MSPATIELWLASLVVQIQGENARPLCTGLQRSRGVAPWQRLAYLQLEAWVALVNKARRENFIKEARKSPPFVTDPCPTESERFVNRE